MTKIYKYVLVDILKNKMMLAYSSILFLLTYTVFSLDDNTAKALLTLLNLVLFIVPLVSIIFSTIYAYNSAEFIELLASQPVKRQDIWIGLVWGLTTALLVAFLLGVALPVLWFEASETSFYLILSGSFLTLIFSVLALIPPVLTKDKAQGIGISLLMWLYFAIIFDGLVLFLLFQFSEYPLEKIMLVVSLFNPVDLGRILVLLKMDFSALMGYTGAVFKDFLGSSTGMMVSISTLFLWVLIPLLISLFRFKKADL